MPQRQTARRIIKPESESRWFPFGRAFRPNQRFYVSGMTALRRRLYASREHDRDRPDAAGARAAMHERRTAVASPVVVILTRLAVTRRNDPAEQAFVHEEAWQR